MVTIPGSARAMVVCLGMVALSAGGVPARAGPGFGVRASVFGLGNGPSEHQTPNTEARTPNTEARTPNAAEAPASASTSTAPAVPAKLSLQECLTLALEHNAGYKRSLVSLANAGSRLRAANQLRHTTFDTELAFGQSSRGGSTTLSTFGPTVSLSQPSGAGFTGSAVVPGYNSPDQAGQANLEYILPLLRGRGKGSETRAQLIQARIDADRAGLSHFDNEQELIQSVVQAYFNAMRAQDLLRIQEQAVKIAEQVTSDTQKRLDAGLIVEIDLTRAKLQLSSTRERLLAQQQSYLNALDSLVLVLGLPVGAQPELTDTISYTYTPIDEGAAIQAALERRPDLAQLRLQQTDADVQLALAQTRRKPRADVRFNLASLGFTLFGGGGFTNVLTSLLGLRVSVPVKERALQENISQAERNRDILDDEYEFRRQGIVNEVRRLVRAAENARSNIELLTQNLDVAKQSQHIAQRRFEEGLADNRDLLDAQASLTATESSVLSAKVDYFLTMTDLRRAMGLALREYFKLPPPEVVDPTAETQRTRSPDGTRSQQSANTRRNPRGFSASSASLR